ncbi:hypothetical protein DP685_22015 [Salmonella enterica subsp. enterica serovar Mikawasima]|uniref:Putative endolysin n=1 Tax=Escherichia phage vB_EcoM_EC001 TaxID=2739754 RepID=A0A7D4V027_9CAUD|nr:hypothetical protein [Salmonella enterica subsp. enterica serovar Mikawasima]QKN86039.1 putative endolysin [Escherichia phage vB_EcoM_EC001]
MFRTILFLLVAVTTFNSNASYQSTSNKHQKEFVLIQDQFNEIKPLIVSASRKQGVHAGMLATTIYRESRFNKNVGKNKSSSASSVVQMTTGTKRSMIRLYGKQLNIPKNADLNKPKYAVQLAAVYMKHIEDHLTKQLKRKPSTAEIALGYRFGESAAVAMIKKKSSVGKRWMDSYRKDAAFYGAKMTPPKAETRQLAFAKEDRDQRVAELQKIWDTLYTKISPAAGTLLANNTIMKGALL